MSGLDSVGLHNKCFLFNFDKFLCFIFRLVPFFFNIIKKQGGIFFAVNNFILLKWFHYNALSKQQEFILIWKGGVFSNFFCTKFWSTRRDSGTLTKLPIGFFFFNFDKYLSVFKEVDKFNLPIIGLFGKILNPNLVYSFGEFYQSFFITCFFFKFFSRFFKKIA